MRHATGQELVCTYKGDWANNVGTIFPGPVFNEIVTYDGVDPTNPDCIYLKEYNFIAVTARGSFYGKWFHPVTDITELTEILKHETQEV